MQWSLLAQPLLLGRVASILESFRVPVDLKTFKYGRFSFELHETRDLQCVALLVSSHVLLGRVASILESFRVHCGLEDFQVWSLLVRATVARSVASDTLQVFGSSCSSRLSIATHRKSRVYTRLERLAMVASRLTPTVATECGKYTCVFGSCGLETFDGRFSFRKHETRDLQWSLLVQPLLLGRVASILESFRVPVDLKTFKYGCFSFEPLLLGVWQVYIVFSS